MSAGLEVADVFRRHGEAYRRLHDGHLGRVERRVMSAIELCRTAALGGHTEACAECGLVRCAYNSCRNRHCPKCQGWARAEWFAARQAALLPVPYFHVVFTLPALVAEIAFHNKARVYAMLFRAAAETLLTIAADPKHLGAEIGLVAVLHTWGQNLHHHPHVHCVVPGGGPSRDGTRWVACRPGFFLPVRVLSRLFRRLFLDKLHAAFAAGDLGFFGELAALAEPSAFTRRLRELRRVEWVVYAKPPFGGPAQVLAYLGRYTHRVAIANSRLVSVTDAQVAFRWKDYRDHGKTKLMTLCRRRVHPPLPAARPAGRLPSDPPLRLPREPPARRQARALSPAARRAIAGTARRTGPGCRPVALARSLPDLWRRHGRARCAGAPDALSHTLLG